MNKHLHVIDRSEVGSLEAVLGKNDPLFGPMKTNKSTSSVGQLAGPDTPTDQLPTPSEGTIAGPKPKRAKKQRRYQLFDDGQGDYRIYLIAGEGEKLPPGTLSPIPGIPGFKTSAEAIKGVRINGQKLMNKQVIVLRGLQIFRVELESEPQMKVSSKPRKQIAGAPQDP